MGVLGLLVLNSVLEATSRNDQGAKDRCLVLPDVSFVFSSVLLLPLCALN